MRDRSLIFFLTLASTLLVGTLLSFKTTSMGIYYIGYYGLCFFILKSFDYGPSFFMSFQTNAPQRPEPKLIVAGEEVSPNTLENEQEDRFLNFFDHGRLLKRRIITWILFLSGIWFFYYHHRIEVSAASIIPLVSCFLIIHSFYVGHLLLALMLNALMVGYSFDPEVPFVFYLLYGFIFTLSLYLTASEAPVNRKKLLSLGVMSLLFISLVVGLVYAIPKENPFTNTPPETSIQNKKELRQHLRQQKLDLQKYASVISQMSELGNLAPELPELNLKLDANAQSIAQMEQLLMQDHLSNEEKAHLIQELNRLMSDQKFLSQQLENMSKSKFGKVEMSQLEKEGLKKLDEVQAVTGGRALTDEERNNLNSYANKIQEQMKKAGNDPKIKEMAENGLKELDTLMQKETLGPQEMEQLKGALKEVNAANEASAKKFDIPKPLPMKPVVEEEKTPWFGILKKLLPMGILVLVFFLMNYFLKKKGIKKIDVADPEILEGLKKDWQALRRRKLSPREEVILYYNLFHESLQKIHYASHETPPSCIVYEDMKELNPELEKSTLVITEVFAQCLYGDKKVTTEALKMYRQGLNKVLKVYRLS